MLSLPIKSAGIIGQSWLYEEMIWPLLLLLLLMAHIILMMLCCVSRTKEKEDSQHSTQPWIQSLPQCVHSEAGAGTARCWWGPHSAGDISKVTHWKMFFIFISSCKNLCLWASESILIFSFKIIRLWQNAGLISTHNVSRRIPAYVWWC